MGNLLNTAISIGPFGFLLGLLVAITCFVLQLFAPQRSQVLRRVLIAAGLAIVGFVAGTALGIAVFCSVASSGNLCGLGGVFGTGPLVAGLSMAGYAVATLRAPRGAA